MIEEKSISFPVDDIGYIEEQYSKYLNGTLNVTELAFNIKERNDTDIIQLDTMYIKVAQFNWTDFWTVEVAEYTIAQVYQSSTDFSKTLKDLVPEDTLKDLQEWKGELL